MNDMEKNVCKICGSEDVNSNHYTPFCGQYNIMESEHVCFNCATWLLHNKNYNPNVFIYKTNKTLCRTSTQHCLMNPYINIGFQGFGGKHIYIMMLETNEVIETNNLWFQGDIPKYLQHLEGLKENCKLISKEEFYRISIEQGKNKILKTYISREIGQIKIEDALKEINRMNKQEGEQIPMNPYNVWRIDFSEYLFCYDETDEYVNNPCKLSEGYCWITSEPTHMIVDLNDNPIKFGDRGILNEELIRLNKTKKYKVIKNQFDYE